MRAEGVLALAGALLIALEAIAHAIRRRHR